MRRILVVLSVVAFGCDDFEALRRAARCGADASLCLDGGSGGGDGGGPAGGGSPAGGGAAGGGAAAGGGSAGGGTAGGGGGSEAGGGSASGGGSTSSGAEAIDFARSFSFLSRGLAQGTDQVVVFGEISGGTTRVAVRADGGITSLSSGEIRPRFAYGTPDSGLFAVAGGPTADGGGYLAFYAVDLANISVVSLPFVPDTFNIYPTLSAAPWAAAVYGSANGERRDLWVAGVDPSGGVSSQNHHCDGGFITANRIRYTPETDGLVVGTLNGVCEGLGLQTGFGGFGARFGSGNMQRATFGASAPPVALDRTPLGMVAAWRSQASTTRLGRFGATGQSLADPSGSVLHETQGLREVTEVVGASGVPGTGFWLVSTVPSGADFDAGRDLAVGTYDLSGTLVREWALRIPGDQTATAATWLPAAGRVVVTGHCTASGTNTLPCPDGGTFVVSLDPAKL